jgi:hypothetical protein
MRGLHIPSFLTKTKLSFATGLVFAVVGLFALSTVAVQKVSAADCDSNAIIYCGFTSPGDFIGKIQANDSGNSHQDLQAVYAHEFFGGQSLSASQYSNFSAHAVAGTAYKDGRIVVNGQTVANGVSSIGREASYQGAGYQTYTVGSTNYYGNTNAQAFGSDNLPVYVLFDAQGNMQFAVLQACGNPIFGPPVRSSASCQTLQKSAVSGELNTYNFTATAAQSGNASITKYVYDFGDGTPTVTMTNGTTPVKHTYTKAGNWTAKVTVYASFPGSSNVPLTVISDCTKVITVVLPDIKCVALTATELDKAKFTYRFVVMASATGGATFKSTTYTLGDGNTKSVDASGNTTTLDYTYAKAGNYNISAQLYSTVNGQTVAANYQCTASVSPYQPPVSTCKPGIPVGDKRCEVCRYDSSLSVDSPKCVAPPQAVLPNTGAGNTIAIFAAVAVGGFIIYRQLLFRKHKAAFLDAQNGTSPLPLGDPMNEEAPLAGTPLETKRKSFRRPRQF